MVLNNWPFAEHFSTYESTPGPLAPAMKAEIPGVVNTCHYTDGQNNQLFKIGDKAWKPKGYKFPCTIVSVFYTVAGEIRIVAEMDDYGMLHIFNETQLEHYE